MAAAVGIRSDNSIDAGMSDALKRYQSRHGLAITGDLDRATPRLVSPLHEDVASA